ncbi:28S rRNA (cytosine-C(5))-methyltransferase [Schistocerca americana]|uniref:28S rRNA (cytosine-C(5))-methyltransferase n=1 Tax=Schistocerca americana TaxID=7009 RepID=UPI001F5032E2|nr:28S rRNA (cytosine-C(5))-methyltransferase [Schistocerca americana]
MSEKKSHSVKVPRTYKVAAKILKEVIAGGNLKTLVYNQRFYNIKALYALVVEALRHAKVLDYVIEKSEILLKEERLDPSLARILISELLWGKRQLPGNSKPVETVISYKDELVKAEHCYEEFLSKEQESRRVTLPRYVRVNTIYKSVEDVVKYFCSEGWEKMRIKFKSYSQYLEKIRSLKEEQFMQDFHIKELLVFPPKTDFHEHDLYINGSIILQDKASCLPAYLLAPEPGSTVLDMCAAPGMKTTHLAALMENRGKIYAVERDLKRYDVLKNTVKLSGATCVETLLGDSLSISSSDVPGVEYILVDPSCSGSGIVDRIELEPERSSDPSRLYKLGGFQIKLLHHALTEFPLAKKVIYSTCSLNVEENEEVVQKVMSYFPDPPEFKLVKKILPDTWKNRGNKCYVGGKYCLYSRPEEDLTNGFFIAVFERHNGSCEKEKCTDKYARNSEKPEETSLKIPETGTAHTEIASSHDILKDSDRKLKLVKHHRKKSRLKICDANTTALEESIEDELDGLTREATTSGKTYQTEHFQKKDSLVYNCTENLSHETRLAKFGQNLKAKKLKKIKSVSDHTNSSQETTSGSLLGDTPTVNISSEKISHIGSNNSHKNLTVETGNSTKSKSEVSDDYDTVSVNHKRKKQKTTSESIFRGRIDKSESHSSSLDEHSLRLDIPKEVVNMKKKKKTLVEKSNELGDVQESEDSNMLNKRHSLKKKRTSHYDDDCGSVNILGSVTRTVLNNVISDSYDSPLNKFSYNLEETNHSKKKKRKKEEKCDR